MMCQLLESAGLTIADDGMRQPDEHNPYGYYEVEGIIDKIKANPNYLNSINADAIKILSLGLEHLKNKNHKIICMRRGLMAVTESMHKIAPLEDEKKTRRALAKLDTITLDRLQQDFRNYIVVGFENIIVKRQILVNRIQDFLGADIDTGIIRTRP